MGKLLVAVAWFLPLCAVVLLLPAMMLSDIAFAQESTVTIDPTQGPPVTLVRGTETNWQLGDRMQISWDSGEILANTTVGSDGAFSASFNVPASATEGAHTIYFTDLDSRYVLVTTFTVAHVSTLVDLSPTAILFNCADQMSGRMVSFDSGVQNSGSQGTEGFHVRWFGAARGDQRQPESIARCPLHRHRRENRVDHSWGIS
jgi:hypothetical protein